MWKIAIGAGAALAAVILSAIIAMFATLPPKHVVRRLLWRDADIKDYQKFPAREIANEGPAFYFDKGLDESLPAAFADIPYESSNTSGGATLVKAAATTSAPRGTRGRSYTSHPRKTRSLSATARATAVSTTGPKSYSG